MDPLKKKILIADDSEKFITKIKNDLKSHSFIIETTTSGNDCLQKLETFKPDLVIVDFMLPEVNGVEILKAVKKTPSSSSVGVILTSYHPMVQNYHCAAKLGANYFLKKPYQSSSFFELVELFFWGDLKLNPFPEKKHDAVVPSTPLFKRPKENSYLKFWGTRGSNPVAGIEYMHFGGNTPCLEVRNGEDLLIIDAGSGIRALGQDLGTQANIDLNILISHTHWDHLLGFPFFFPLYQPKRKICIFSPAGFEKNTSELFSDMLAYSYFPVAIDDIQSNLTFKNAKDSEVLTFGSITVSTHYAFHPGSTLCFKLQIGEKKIGYVTDNEFLLGCHLHPSKVEHQEDLFTPYSSLIHFLKECDILIHEAQYTQEEYLSKEGWGHSSVYNACMLIKKANIKHWIVTHHDPKHSDDFLFEKEKFHREVLKELKHHCKVEFAYDGMILSLDNLS